MRKSILTPRRAQAGLVAVLLVSSLLPWRWADAISRRPRYLLAAALAPTDHLLKPLADTLRRPADLPVDVGNQEEYQRALQQIVQLQYQLRQANERVAELGEIRSHLQLAGVGLLPATVTAWSGDRLHPTVTINRGSRHGVAHGMAVVRAFNLVGRVIQVGPVTATVGLIHGPRSHLIVMVKPPTSSTEPREMICQLSTAQGQEAFWASTDVDDPIRIGDLAHLYDDVWPPEARGFVVGKITQIDKHPNDPLLRRRPVVTPIRSLAHLDWVTVLVPIKESTLRSLESDDN